MNNKIRIKFKGIVVSGHGTHSDLRIPGRDNLVNASDD